MFSALTEFFFLMFTFKNAANIPWIYYSLEVPVEPYWVFFEISMIIQTCQWF